LKINSTTLQLFSPFNRTVGNPVQYEINSQKEFEYFLDKNNGIKDCSSSVYSINGTIDKVWFDFDGKGAFEDARKVYQYLKEKNAKCIPVISGKKGIHLHLLIKSDINVDSANAKAILMDTVTTIAHEALGLKDWSQETSLDWTKAGVLHVTCRIPNTLRPPENSSYCSYIPEDWYTLSNSELWSYAKQPNEFHYTGKVLPIETFISESPVFQGIQTHESNKECISISTLRIPDNMQEFLKKVMRPCLYRHIISKNPNHYVRVAATIDFLYAGFSPTEILTIYSKCGWSNFNSNITKEKITYLAQRVLKYNDLSPYSCQKLRVMKIPRMCCVD